MNDKETIVDTEEFNRMMNNFNEFLASLPIPTPEEKKEMEISSVKSDLDRMLKPKKLRPYKYKPGTILIA